MKSSAIMIATAMVLGACGQQGRGENSSSGQADGATATTDVMGPDTATTQGSVATPGVTAMEGATPATGAMDATTYVATAASGDMYEIQSSQMALKNSRDSNVQGFATRMIKDHQATTTQLKQLAQQANIMVPTQMQPRHAQMLAALQAASGSGFDQLYWEQQRTAHAEAVDLHRSMSQRADLPTGLAGFAKATLAKVEGHYTMLNEQASMAGSGMGAAGVSSTGPAQGSSRPPAG